MNATEKRAEAVRLMKSRAKLNTYTNGGDRKYFFGKPDNVPGNTTQKGWSDCSSAVRKAIMAASGIDIGSNTDAQLRNRAKGVVVDTTDGYYPDESKLLPGDCLYFKGNTSHTLDVGHVEMYTGANECYGHGSGTGPTRHVLRDYCKGRASSAKRYFMAVRWIVDSDGIVGANTWAELDADMDGQNDDETAKPAEPKGNLTVKSGSWNVRTGPGTDYAIAAVMHGGDKLNEILPTGWVPVLYNGEIRWISEKAVD